MPEKATAPDKEGIFANMKVGVRQHFLDSGSFTIWTLAEEWAKETGQTPEDYYDTHAFYEYMDAYAAFIKKHRHAIDYYANVDAIGFPELTYRNQKYLEKKHGLSPVPVVHFRTATDWLSRYLERGHGLVALGGLVGSTAQDICRKWLDRCFHIICDGKDRLPRARVHGFGVTSFPLLHRYPWWSVDSTTWTMVGAMGGVIVPHRRDGKWVYRRPYPYIVKFSNKAKERTMAGKHYDTMSPGQRAVVRHWLDELGIPVGATAKDGTIEEYGVVNRHCERKAANLLFFERMRKTLPKYPWPFLSPIKGSLGIKT